MTVVQDSTSPRECVSGMKKNAFSQMPVFSGGKKVGTATDGNITTLLSAAQESRNALGCAVIQPLSSLSLIRRYAS